MDHGTAVKCVNAAMWDIVESVKSAPRGMTGSERVRGQRTRARVAIWPYPSSIPAGIGPPVDPGLGRFIGIEARRWAAGGRSELSPRFDQLWREGENMPFIAMPSPADRAHYARVFQQDPKMILDPLVLHGPAPPPTPYRRGR